MTDAELDKLDRLCDAASDGPWDVGHSRDGREGFSITSDWLDTVCVLDMNESGAFDDETRERIAADFNFIAAARSALPALIGDVRRLRADQPLVVG